MAIPRNPSRAEICPDEALCASLGLIGVDSEIVLGTSNESRSVGSDASSMLSPEIAERSSQKIHKE